jgi:hypothetical protein
MLNGALRPKFTSMAGGSVASVAAATQFRDGGCHRNLAGTTSHVPSGTAVGATFVTLASRFFLSGCHRDVAVADAAALAGVF